MIARAVLVALSAVFMSGCASMTGPSQDAKVAEWDRWIKENGGEPPERYTPYGTDKIEIRLSGVTDLPDLPYPGRIDDWRSMTLVLKDGDLHGEGLSILNTISRKVSRDYKDANPEAWPRITLRLENLNLHDSDLKPLKLGDQGNLFGPRRQIHYLSLAGNELTQVPEFGDLGIETHTNKQNRFDFSNNSIQTIERVGRHVRRYARWNNVENETTYNFSGNPVRQFDLDNDRVSLNTGGNIEHKRLWPWEANLIIKDEHGKQWPILHVPESGVDGEKTVIIGHAIQYSDDYKPAEPKDYEDHLGEVFIYRPRLEEAPEKMVHETITTESGQTIKLMDWKE